MPYIDSITAALVEVLNHASDGPPERFAGYAANREFWVAEAMHCLDVIAGYPARFTRMKEASQQSHPAKCDWPTIPISEPRMTNSELSNSRKIIREAARRFLRRCLKMCPQDQEAIMRNAKQLGVPTPL